MSDAESHCIGTDTASASANVFDASDQQTIEAIDPFDHTRTHHEVKGEFDTRQHEHVEHVHKVTQREMELRFQTSFL